MENIYTIKEVATMYKVVPKTVYEWVKRGLVITKIGRITRIKESDLRSFMEVVNENTGY